LWGAEGSDELAGPDAPGDLGVTPATLAHLRGRYGGHARALAAMIGAASGLGDVLVPGLPYLRAEAVFAVRYEMASTLDDVLSRRTRAVILDARATIAAAPDVAALIAPELGWDDDERQRQVAAFVAAAQADLDAAGLGSRATQIGAP
jgi:glycerol-3-phosphate dehydrogenase